MLKWAVPNQRRSICNTNTSESTTASDSNHETCSNASSSDSSSSESIYDLSVPIRYHERRASRPKSLAIFNQENSTLADLEKLDSVKQRRTVNHRTSSVLYSSCARANRHSMYIIPSSHDNPEHRQKSQTLDNMHAYRNTPSKLSVHQPTTPVSTNIDSSTTSDVESDEGILKISTTGIDKTKSSRNSFWKSLRLKAQGKNKDKKLSKAHSMSNLPVSPKLTNTEVYTDSPTVTQPPPPQMLSVDTTTSAATHDISPSYKSRTNVLRRRSFKLIKRENENKKPKRFSKALEYSEQEVLSSSPDSGVSSLRLHSNDSDNPTSPTSPITPINLELTNLPCLKQQFTETVLQYLNERLEKKGYSSTISVSSSARSSRSDDGSSDVFCYDTDTVLRRPHHNNNNTIKATF